MLGFSDIGLVATVALILAGGLGVWVAAAFNRLVRGRNLVREGFSGIDVQLKRRQDLVPNLVETVRGYADFERTVLEEVTAARSRSEQAEDAGRMQNEENRLTDGLKRLFALAEAYPELRADRNFAQLQEQLTEIEDQIQYARRYYNGAVRDFNTRVEAFPSNLVARAFGFRLKPFFQIATATAREAPKVEVA
jgi:LemA protein